MRELPMAKRKGILPQNAVPDSLSESLGAGCGGQDHVFLAGKTKHLICHRNDRSGVTVRGILGRR